VDVKPHRLDSPVPNAGTGPTVDGEPISPELALVSAELGALARAQLPDRPWERFAAPRTRADSRPPADREGASARSPQPALRTVASFPRRPAPVVHSPAPRPRRGALKAALALALFAGVVHLGAWESGGERLLPPEASSSPTAPVTLGPYPATRYLGAGGVGFDVDDSGSFLLDVRLPDVCAGAILVVPRIAIGARGTFAFSGVLPNDPPVAVTVAGRFVRREEARATVRAEGPGCAAGTLGFRATVS
jgi:hypothetical protein